MYTTHGRYFGSPVPGEDAPGSVRAVCDNLTMCPTCTDEILRLMPHSAPLAMPPVLNSPAPTVPSLPSTGKSSPVQVPIDGIKDWYQRFLELKDAAKQIEDMLDEARSAILDSVKSQFTELPTKTDFTIDGKPVLQRQVIVQNRVDTKRLKAERPNMYSQYLKSYEQERLNIL